ncbi:MAG: DUF3822 family protein [Bacteroidota bacterium]
MGITYHIIENEFQRDQTSAYKLSILAGMDSLVYAVYHGDSNKLLLLKTVDLKNDNGSSTDYSARLDDACGREDVLNPVYGQVKIAFLEPATSLIPSRLFNEEEKKTYLEVLITEEKSSDVFADDLASLKIRPVYPLTKDLTTVLDDRFPNNRVFSAATPFLAGTYHSIPEGVDEAAFACFQKNSFQLALFSNGELLFYNNFKCKSASDVLYFILLAFEQNSLDPNRTPLFLTGHVVTDSEIYKLLYRYIAELKFLDLPSFFEIGKSAESFDPNFFFPLHSLLLCE